MALVDPDPLDYVKVHCDASGYLPYRGNGEMGTCPLCGSIVELVELVGFTDLNTGRTPTLVLVDHEYQKRIGGQFT